MSQNGTAVEGLLFARHTEGYRKYHAVPKIAIDNIARSSAPRLNPRTHTRPICGIRGRDASGFPTIEIISDGSDGYVPFDLETPPTPTPAINTPICPRCVMVARRMQDGTSLIDATRIRAPHPTQKVLDQVASDDTAVTIRVTQDIETSDHLTGSSERRMFAIVTSAPLRTTDIYSSDYREDVTYPNRLVEVRLRIKTEDGQTTESMTGGRRLLHPKSLKPTVGKKLNRYESVDENDEDVIAVAKLLRERL